MALNFDSKDIVDMKMAASSEKKARKSIKKEKKSRKSVKKTTTPAPNTPKTFDDNYPLKLQPFDSGCQIAVSCDKWVGEWIFFPQGDLDENKQVVYKSNEVKYTDAECSPKIGGLPSVFTLTESPDNRNDCMLKFFIAETGKNITYRVLFSNDVPVVAGEAVEKASNNNVRTRSAPRKSIKKNKKNSSSSSDSDSDSASGNSKKQNKTKASRRTVTASF